MKKVSMEEARGFAIRQVKKMLLKDGKLDVMYIKGINKMLEYLDALPEEEEK